MPHRIQTKRRNRSITDCHYFIALGPVGVRAEFLTSAHGTTTFILTCLDCMGTNLLHIILPVYVGIHPERVARINRYGKKCVPWGVGRNNPNEYITNPFSELNSPHEFQSFHSNYAP
jgi:hypothetical protein